MEKKMRLGIYGGTFSPPHLGHVRAAEAFLTAMELDELLIMPTFLPPHKEAGGIVSADLRLSMCRLAFSGLSRTEISDFEIKKGGKSYTYITLGELSAPDKELYFLVGTDMFLTLGQWKRPDIIFSLAKIALVRREDDSEITEQIKQKCNEYKEKFGAEICLIDANVTEISSSELRLWLTSGEDTSEFLPEAVRDFIDENALYVTRFTDEELSDLREKISRRLGKERFAHTLGVERAAEKIADACLPSSKSALRAAALLHDIAKEYSDEELFEILKSEPSLTKEDLESPKLYHAFAGPFIIKRDFPELAKEEILSAVFNHTTGRAEMSLFEEIIFVADYIDDTREYSECVEAGAALYEKLPGSSRERSIEALHECAYRELDNTVSRLIKKGLHVNSRTLAAKHYIKEIIKKRL